MTLAFRYAARSDVGLLRKVNQDSGYAGPHLLVLADGMGGPAGGDVASSVALAHLAPLDGDAHSGDSLSLLREAIVEAHTDLRTRAEGNLNLKGMGTTVIAALRTGKRMAMVHIGDSRAYLVREGEVIRLTTDHTYVQHLVDLGQITEEEAENHPQRSVILRVLGDHDMGVELDESVRELAAGDRFLLCSDGLSSYVSAETINTTLTSISDPEACADALIDLALRAGGPDNVTVVLADVVELDDLPDGAAPATTPQVVGSATEHWKAPTKGGSSAAARAAALLAAGTDDDAEPTPSPEEVKAEREREEAKARRRRRWPWIIAIAAALAVIAGGLYAGYRWTQTQYYVAASGDYVAIYQGIPPELGPITLHHPVTTTDILVEDLPTFAQNRLEGGITPDDGSREGAQEIVDSLAEEVPSETATPTPTPTPTPRATRSTPSPTTTTQATG